MSLKEFGSDFHYIESYYSEHTHLTDVFRDTTLLADGRQCIVVLIRQYGWRRIWMPDYFCYEVIESIKERTGIEVLFYADNPLNEGQVESLPFQQGDVLLRMNYFGLRDVRSNADISIPVIEDHSHDPFGHWALYSDADWCIASIRKSLPLPEGGMMWSPKGHELAVAPQSSEDNEKIAAIRWKAMEMKAAYLTGRNISKEEFRKLFIETEEWFGQAEPTQIDERSKRFISKQFDLHFWLEVKHRNWSLLKEFVSFDKCEYINPEHEACSMFSLVLLLENKTKRDKVRRSLIENCVYPAILWNVPETVSEESKIFSERMLSIHCDGRYNEEEIKHLAGILNKVLEQ